MSEATADQFDLISDDPRRDSRPAGALADFVKFYRESRAHHGLLTQGQAARILDVSTSHVTTWVRRGRLSCVEIAGLRMVSAAEILALHKEREQGIKAVGGRGIKAPSLTELARSSFEDCFGDEKSV